MSKTLWLASYYPKPAKDVPANEAALHSLRKWEGLRPDTLKLHGLRRSHRGVYDGETQVLYVDESSCALCQNYLELGQATSAERCAKCPLAIARDGVPCDKLHHTEKETPWAAFSIHGNPEPMIKELERTVTGTKLQPEPKPTHSPTPWTARPASAERTGINWWAIDLPNGGHFNVLTPNAEQDAKFIERCVNHHDEVVALLYRVEQELHTPHDREILTTRTALMSKIRNLIAKLEGGE